MINRATENDQLRKRNVDEDDDDDDDHYDDGDKMRSIKVLRMIR